MLRLPPKTAHLFEFINTSPRRFLNGLQSLSQIEGLDLINPEIRIHNVPGRTRNINIEAGVNIFLSD